MILERTTDETPQAQRNEPRAFDAAGLAGPQTPLWRRLLASALVATAAVIGVVAAALYVYLLCSDPPHMLRAWGVVGLVFFIPLLILCVPIWLAGWVADRIDPSRRAKGADRLADKA
jgi:hypothetical protein